ncbi:MAG: EF-hand domain-containing protein [Proteobacteria bacterium]|nr:EF-hand domain-containing protein [Pseudomonadota bacterium]
MKASTTRAVLLGAIFLAGTATLALAHEDGPPPPDGPMRGLVHRPKLSERLLAEFDTNKDGKITKAEFNNVIGSRFAAVAHGAKAISPDQFASLHQADFQKHVAEMFRRTDWNGDGKLSFDEYVAPQRAHFQMMDHDGSGVVTCHSPRDDDANDADGPPPPDGPPPRGGDAHGRHGGHHGFGGRGFGRAKFCGESDTSRDGKVTRAEFDAMMQKDFKDATGGQPFMTLAMFSADQAKDFRNMNDRMFKRLDKNDDGKLDLAEFAAPELKMFARLDRNHDGVITADEMKPRFHGRDGGPRRGGPPPRHGGY